jgi:hypothetical protein
MTVSKHKELVTTSDHDTRLLLQIPRKKNVEESRAMSSKLASEEASKEPGKGRRERNEGLGRREKKGHWTGLEGAGLDWTGLEGARLDWAWVGWTEPDWTGLL